MKKRAYNFRKTNLESDTKNQNLPRKLLQKGKNIWFWPTNLFLGNVCAKCKDSFEQSFKIWSGSQALGSFWYGSGVESSRGLFI